jgi:hypothetical protein
LDAHLTLVIGLWSANDCTIVPVTANSAIASACKWTPTASNRKDARMDEVIVPMPQPANEGTYHWMKIDTDPNENLALFLTNAAKTRLALVSVARFDTDSTWGYLLLYRSLA